MIQAHKTRLFQEARGALLLCRGCLLPLVGPAEAGLCGRCWSGLVTLPPERCPTCALTHGEAPCPGPVAWELGDALWDYRGGSPSLGPLLVPGIKAGERGWRRALLARAIRAELPPWAWEVDRVTAAPSTWIQRVSRGFAFGTEVGRVLAMRIHRPFEPLLTKRWTSGRQATRTESQRRRLPKAAIRLCRGVRPQGTILLVDDVWTTGTTLLRCAQALRDGGADDVRVLTLFRVL